MRIDFSGGKGKDSFGGAMGLFIMPLLTFICPLGHRGGWIEIGGRGWMGDQGVQGSAWMIGLVRRRGFAGWV